jgi:DNA-3-methyladenine glycosylase I
MSYCTYCAERDKNDLHRLYHDFRYGFSIEDDNELFGRLILEINQAGLSWDTILKKEHNFRVAFDEFKIDLIANYSEEKIEELIQNAGIIRNRLKILAVIYNAQQILMIQKEHGSFLLWLESKNERSIEEWVKLFKRTFKFVGKDIVEEFLMSTGFLPGAHKEDCPVYSKIMELKPNRSKI